MHYFSPHADAICRMSPKLNRQNSLPWQRPFRDRKIYFRRIIHGSTNPQNLAKTGLVDFEITGLTKIVKDKIIKKQKQKTSPRGSQAGK